MAAPEEEHNGMREGGAEEGTRERRGGSKSSSTQQNSLKQAEGGWVHGFESSRGLNTRFHSLGCSLNFSIS